MKIATTTEDFKDYAPTHEERVEILRQCGFRHVDLNLYRKGDNLPFMGEDWQENAKRLLDFAGERDMDFVQAHAIGGNPLAPDDLLLDITARSVAVCGVLGIPNIAVHSGVEAGIGKEEFFRKNLEFYRKLYPVMEKTGVRVLIENSCQANMGGCWFMFTGEDMREFLEYADHPLLGACWDTGHANLEGHQYQDIVDLGKHLKAIHFNDNGGTMDEHIMPYMGTMSIDEVMNGLLDSGYDGVFTFECGNSIIFGGGWPHARRTYPQDARAYHPPLAVKMQAEKLMYSIGEHILSQYGITVE